MPIEIRELLIKAVIDGGGKKGGQEAGGAVMGETASGSEPDADQLIDLCVEKVLEILKERQER